MTLDVSVTVTKDALPSITVNPPDLSNAEEAMFVEYIWANWPVVDPDTGVPLERTNANTATVVRSWARAMLRAEWIRAVNHERMRQQNVARNAVSDFSGKADL